MFWPKNHSAPLEQVEIDGHNYPELKMDSKYTFETDLFQFFPELDLISSNQALPNYVHLKEEGLGSPSKKELTQVLDSSHDIKQEDQEIAKWEPERVNNSSGNEMENTEDMESTEISNELETDEQSERYCDKLKMKNLNWSKEDDDVLLQITNLYKNDWKRIAKRFGKLTNKIISPAFAKRRYKSSGDGQRKPLIRFSHQEDLLIVKLITIHSLNWIKIATYFPNRTPLMIKNRYYSRIKDKCFDTLLNEVKELDIPIPQVNNESQN